ncbi:MAG: hypothetical protein NC111_01820 [Bacteroides sp.]|nr:hypothetical protein [Bacteroides sp.]MCM1413802.1 hypothetical protein [Bacteroides sp.]MCM1471254.1 hypothetical protein [Bacteroides sp.]
MNKLIMIFVALLSISANAQVNRILIKTHNPDIIQPIGETRVSFDQAWMGLFNKPYLWVTDKTEIDSIMNILNGMEMREQLKYNTDSPALRLKIISGNVMYFSDSPDIIGQILIYDDENNIELLWITAAGIDRDTTRYFTPIVITDLVKKIGRYHRHPIDNK